MGHWEKLMTRENGNTKLSQNTISRQGNLFLSLVITTKNTTKDAAAENIYNKSPGKWRVVILIKRAMLMLETKLVKRSIHTYIPDVAIIKT